MASIAAGVVNTPGLAMSFPAFLALFLSIYAHIYLGCCFIALGVSTMLIVIS